MPDQRLTAPFELRWASEQNFERIHRSETFGAFIHSTNGQAKTLEAEYEGTVQYFQNPAAEVSAHRVIGPSKVNFSVSDLFRAWHARVNNARWLSLEFVKPARKPFTEQGYTDFQYNSGAEQIARWHLEYGKFPIKQVFSQTEKGLIYHRDSEQGKADGKTDPGGIFDIERLIRQTNAWIRYLSSGRNLVDYENDIYVPVERLKDKLVTTGKQADLAFALTLHNALVQNKEYHRVAKLAGEE